MPTVLEALVNLEEQLIQQEAAEGRADLITNWRDPNNTQRARLVEVLTRLNDLPVADLRMWPSREVAVTLGETRFVWVSFNGYSWHMWTNFGCQESEITTAGMFSFNDEDRDSADMVVQIAHDYLTPTLRAKAEIIPG